VRSSRASRQVAPGLRVHDTPFWACSTTVELSGMLEGTPGDLISVLNVALVVTSTKPRACCCACCAMLSHRSDATLRRLITRTTETEAV